MCEYRFSVRYTVIYLSCHLFDLSPHAGLISLTYRHSCIVLGSHRAHVKSTLPVSLDSLGEMYEYSTSSAIHLELKLDRPRARERYPAINHLYYWYSKVTLPFCGQMLRALTSLQCPYSLQ